MYARVHGYDFVDFDDDVHVTGNAHVTTGLSWANARWAFSAAPVGYWHPVTWLSHQLDGELFGLDAGAHHLENVLLHVANALLVFLLFSRITRRPWPSAFVAALFALHPLHVESVAWVSERKDVLSTLFALLALLAWTRHVERPSPGRYLAALGWFALGLMTKPMLVTLPVLMVLLDVWPLERLRDRATVRRALLEKVPFLALSLVIGVVTLLASQHREMTAGLDSIPLVRRLDNAAGSYLAYVGKTVWPSALAIQYPYPEGDVPLGRLVARVGALLVATTLLVRFGRRRPYAIVGWLWFLVALLPVIGLVQVGAQAMADRWTYVSLIGLFVIVAFGAADLVRGARPRRLLLAPAAVLVLVACTLATSAQVAHWKDGEALFGHAVRVTRGNYFMLMKLATHLHLRGRSPEALPYFEEALRLRPDLADIHINYGNALGATGRPLDALREYRTALDLDPRSALVHFNLGVAHGARGERAAAIRHYREAVRLDPDHAKSHANLGLILLETEQPGPAVEALERALRIDPDDVVALRGLGFALARTGRGEDALEQFRLVLRTRPDDAWVHVNVGILVERQGDLEQAARSYRRALEIDPGLGEARRRLDSVLARRPGG